MYTILGGGIASMEHQKLYLSQVNMYMYLQTNLS